MDTITFGGIFVGIIVNNTHERTKLQSRVSADLREKAQRTKPDDDVDLVEDSDYVKGMKKSHSYSWVWFVLVLLAVISLIIIFML